MRVEFGDTTIVVDIAGANAISRSFPHTFLLLTAEHIQNKKIE